MQDAYILSVDEENWEQIHFQEQYFDIVNDENHGYKTMLLSNPKEECIK